MTITRSQAAKYLEITSHNLYAIERKGDMNFPIIEVLSSRGRKTKGYDKKAFIEWADNDPRLDFCIKKPFIYTGYSAWHILFCQPALLNRGLQYEDFK